MTGFTSQEVNSAGENPRLRYVVPVVWEGVLTATSSIHQGGEKLGFNSYLRRERYALETVTQGRGGVNFVDVPIISGNSLRGILRGLGADLWWVGVGEPELSTAVAHAVWSGGSLAKNSTTTLSGRNLMEVMEVCPVVEIFGTAGGGRIVDGKLSVSKVIPLCEEVTSFVPEEYRHFCGNSFWDFLQMEQYSRRGAKNVTRINSNLSVTSSRGNANSAQVSGETKRVKKTVKGVVGGDELDDVSVRGEGEGVMRYGVESFIPGTKFYVKISAHHLSSSSFSFLSNLIKEFVALGHLGGRSGTGLGSFSAEFNKTPETIDEKVWLNHVESFPTEVILERLGRLS